MSYQIIIPARYHSTRLPGKPLEKINSKTLIQYVYESAIKSSASDVIIATDDRRIQEVAKAFGARVCMTRDDHSSGTDRLAEVVEQLELADDQIIVNLQGDEPMMPAKLLDQVAGSLKQSDSAAMATLCEPIESNREVFDPNIVKVVVDHSGHALYFSRASIPWERQIFANPMIDSNSLNCYRHIGLYAYRCDFLRQYPHLKPCQIEQQEVLEQLRVLYYGYKIKLEVALESSGIGIDTALDLEKFRRIATSD